MRLLAQVLTVLLWLYVGASVVALSVGVVGVVDTPSEPLAMVFAIALAAPWSVLIGSPPGTNSLPGSFVMVALFMAVNTGLLWLLRSAALRAAR